MLSASQALTAARSMGALFSLDATGRPHILGAHTLPPDLMATLKAQRDQVIKLLASEAGEIAPPMHGVSVGMPARSTKGTALTGAPPEWIDGVTSMLASPPPATVSTPRWHEVQAASRRLIAEGWANSAAALGWPMAAMFGADQYAPCIRLDLQGVAWLLRPNDRVLALDGGSLALKTVTGASQRIYRHQGQEVAAVLPWSVGFGSGERIVS